jgi:hypothetical protein
MHAFWAGLNGPCGGHGAIEERFLHLATRHTLGSVCKKMPGRPGRNGGMLGEDR